MIIGLIFPNQLFEKPLILKYTKNIYLVEDDIYFTKYKYHKLKLILHRASMKFYYNYLKKIYKINNIKYINFHELNYLKIIKNNDLIIYDPINDELLDKIQKVCHETKSNLKIIHNQLFIETDQILTDYYNSLKNHTNYIHDNGFYRWQRKRLNILWNQKNDMPLYNKLSFDSLNRNKFDNNYKENRIKINNNIYVNEAKKYVNIHFLDNFGSDKCFIYPITFKESKKLFSKFIKNNLKDFGKYQDAISSDIIIGNHSLLSSSLNIGIIDVSYILKKILKYFNNLNEINKKLYTPSVEAFIRQLIGWRSYVRFIYKFHGREMYHENNLNHNLNLPKSWYNANTTILPLDNVIKKVYLYAYAHHIERLMIAGNFAIINQINPIQIYKWFMICFIDSYEWVMIPNVMGMSQFSSKTIKMMTRPYFSSSNYILKMSNYKKIKSNKDLEWYDIWDILYYYFIFNNISLLKKNYATARNVVFWNKKSDTEKKNIINLAKKILQK